MWLLWLSCSGPQLEGTCASDTACEALDQKLEACVAGHQAEAASLARIFGHRQDRLQRCCDRAHAVATCEPTPAPVAPDPQPEVVASVAEFPTPMEQEVFLLPCPDGAETCLPVHWVFYSGHMFPFAKIAPEQQRVVGEQIEAYLRPRSQEDLLLVAVGATSQEGTPASQEVLACERASWLAETLGDLRPDATVRQLVLGQHLCADLEVPARCGRARLSRNAARRAQGRFATAYQRPVGFFSAVLGEGVTEEAVVQRILDFVFVSSPDQCDGSLGAPVPSASCYPNAQPQVVERCR